MSEDLPNQLIKKHNLLDKFEMIKTLHMPLNDEALINALKRLKYEEALHFQYKMMHQKSES